jgi:hypothetical protein
MLSTTESPTPDSPTPDSPDSLTLLRLRECIDHLKRMANPLPAAQATRLASPLSSPPLPPNPLDQVDIASYVLSYLDLKEIDVTRRLSRSWLSQSEAAAWSWFSHNVAAFSLSNGLWSGDRYIYRGYDFVVKSELVTVTFCPFPWVGVKPPEKGDLMEAVSSVYGAYFVMSDLLRAIDPVPASYNAIATLAGRRIRVPLGPSNPAGAGPGILRRDNLRLEADYNRLKEDLGPYPDLDELVGDCPEAVDWDGYWDGLKDSLRASVKSYTQYLITFLDLMATRMHIPPRFLDAGAGVDFKLGGGLYRIKAPEGLEPASVERTLHRARRTRGKPALVYEADWLRRGGSVACLAIHVTCPIERWAEIFAATRVS